MREGGSIVIDLHNDTIVEHIRRAKGRLRGDPLPPPSIELGTVGLMREARRVSGNSNDVQIDFAKMVAGGIDVALFAVDVTVARGSRLVYALDGIGYFLNRMVEPAGTVAIVKSTEEMIQAKENHQPSAMLCVEHAGVLEGSINVLRGLFELGVRSIGLTHNLSSEAADGCMESREGVGLTRFGVALVEEMNRLGMAVDLAHVSRSAFFHALEISSKPVLFSHGNADALCGHPRNLTDEQLRALAENGGVIGLSFVPDFVDLDKPSLERLIDHIEHIATVAGVETVAIGSDFDGGGMLIRDATQVPQIAEALDGRGLSEQDIDLIMGGNAFRVLKAAIG